MLVLKDCSGWPVNCTSLRIKRATKASITDPLLYQTPYWVLFNSVSFNSHSNWEVLAEKEIKKKKSVVRYFHFSGNKFRLTEEVWGEYGTFPHTLHPASPKADILHNHHCTMIETRKLMLIRCYWLLHRSYSYFAIFPINIPLPAQTPTWRLVDLSIYLLQSVAVPQSFLIVHDLNIVEESWPVIL